MGKPATRITVRAATLGDGPMLEQVISASARDLGRLDYSHEQIEAALEDAWGVDTELIRDNTYFTVEADGEVVGCGGWSRRRTLFGSDKQGGRQSEQLDPKIDAARIRAFFVRPDWARQGIGRLLLRHCEEAAKAEGFGEVELMATLPGQHLYQACGYEAAPPISHILASGISIMFVPMRKKLMCQAAQDEDEHARFHAALHEGEQAIQEGRTAPAEQVFADTETA